MEMCSFPVSVTPTGVFPEALPLRKDAIAGINAPDTVAFLFATALPLIKDALELTSTPNAVALPDPVAVPGMIEALEVQRAPEAVPLVLPLAMVIKPTASKATATSPTLIR